MDQYKNLRSLVEETLIEDEDPKMISLGHDMLNVILKKVTLFDLKN